MDFFLFLLKKIMKNNKKNSCCNPEVIGDISEKIVASSMRSTIAALEEDNSQGVPFFSYDKVKEEKKKKKLLKAAKRIPRYYSVPGK